MILFLAHFVNSFHSMAIIFQYGSNMSSERINHKTRLAGDAKMIGTAKTLEKFELGFTVYSQKNRCAAADIVPGKTGRSIYGVLYDIPDYLLARNTAEKFGRRSLDTIENEGKNYVRQLIKLFVTGGPEIEALTYVVKNRRNGIKTAPQYVRHILHGIREHNIPENYFQYAKRKIQANNPNIQIDIPGN